MWSLYLFLSGGVMQRGNGPGYCKKKCHSQAIDTILRNAPFSENVAYTLFQYLFIVKYVSYSWVAEGLTSSL